MPAYLIVDTAIENADDLDRPRSDSGSAHPVPKGHKGAGPTKPLDQRYCANTACLLRSIPLDCQPE